MKRIKAACILVFSQKPEMCYSKECALKIRPAHFFSDFLKKNAFSLLTNPRIGDIIISAIERKANAERKNANGEWCNGSTYDSDSYCLGSNPSSPALCLRCLEA